MRLQCFGVALLIASVAVCADAMQPDLFDEIYARGKPIESGLRTLTARFTETSSSELLTTPLVASGTLTVVRPTTVLLNYTAPEPRTVSIEGDVMRVVWPSRSIDRTTGIGPAQRRIQQYFVDKSPAQLRRHFDISARQAADRPANWLVTMQPTRKQILAGLGKLELWIDQKTVVLAAMQLTFPNGDTKLMEFFDVAINPVIP